MYCLGQKPLDVECVDLSTVTPLLNFLHTLEQNGSDRELTETEDDKAVQLIHSLFPPYYSSIDQLVSHFTRDHKRQERTLGAWYLMTRKLAEGIQSGS